jgi:hypothetical protein
MDILSLCFSNNQFPCSWKWLFERILTLSICNLAVGPESCFEKGISQFQGLSLEKMPCEVLVCHMHDPVLVGHMKEANINDELIMNDE